jgi:hypothetical protein
VWQLCPDSKIATPHKSLCARRFFEKAGRRGASILLKNGTGIAQVWKSTGDAGVSEQLTGVDLIEFTPGTNRNLQLNLKNTHWQEENEK